jgi:hypothetical protein
MKLSLRLPLPKRSRRQEQEAGQEVTRRIVRKEIKAVRRLAAFAFPAPAVCLLPLSSAPAPSSEGSSLSPSKRLIEG